ncbi:hypothetical protein AB0O18_00965 [Streptomyces sp. NPDC093224]|uniref:hypothetical protein n=1 Tax=Streptomyces sp. NPDC093224 TaxID=3155198 RepID=UPI0034316D60
MSENDSFEDHHDSSGPGGQDGHDDPGAHEAYGGQAADQDLSPLYVDNSGEHGYGLEPQEEEQQPVDPYSGTTDPSNAGPPDPVVGDPETAAAYWHQQEAPFSCAVVAQEYVLDRVTGVDRTEADLSTLADEKGWYHPGSGTRIADMDQLLQHHGVPSTLEFGANMDDLRFALADGDHVIVAVDSDELRPGPPVADTTDLEGVPYIPGQGADHAVVVTALDYSDPDAPAVVLNDSSHPDGAGYRVPMDDFYRAWTDSGHVIIRADGAPRPTAEGAPGAGYTEGTNADG